MDCTTCSDEYQKLLNRMNKPRVVVDNAACGTATVIKVDSVRKRGVLLEAVQILTDLDLRIRKGYISSDGQWFMDVFHVTDSNGRKLADNNVTSYMERSLAEGVGAGDPSGGLTVLELAGTERPGLLSEVFAVLADLQCCVIDAVVWTHNHRIAAVVSIREEDTDKILQRLRDVLRCDGGRGSKVVVSAFAPSQVERRLHQLMLEDRDYDCPSPPASASVSVQNWVDRGYSIVNIQCLDRPRLLFDIVCTLTDLDYVVFHGTIDTDGNRARQEFYIRHADGIPISSEAERQRVIQCLHAAIDRRSAEGVRLELCTVDRPGLLADVTRTFRENGLLVMRADITTRDGMATNVFYVKDAGGSAADGKAIEAVREMIGTNHLKVWQPSPEVCHKVSSNGPAAGGLFSFGSLVRRNLYHLGLIRSCS